MSAYGHQMEREYSAQSLSSRGGSEMESRYRVETGIYMSSYAATIFVAGLVTVGVSLMTLLISLAVMLQSCQSKSGGLVEVQKSTDHYDHCKILALHSELNHLDSNSFPEICKQFTVQYIRNGHYITELNITLRLVESYFSTMKPGEDGQDVVLMDADDFFPSELFYIDQPLKQFDQYACADCNKGTRYLNHIFVNELYLKLRDGGWPLVLLSREPERLRNTMVEHLISVGYGGWSSVIMRSDDEIQLDRHAYFSRRRCIMQKQGYRIVAAISSQLDVLTGSCPGERNFKLPNLIFSQKMDDHTQSKVLEE